MQSTLDEIVSWQVLAAPHAVNSVRPRWGAIVMDWRNLNLRAVTYSELLAAPTY